MARPSKGIVARRLLTLIHLMSQSHTRIPLEEIAKTFDISLEEARLDVERLALCGIDDDQRVNIFTASDQAVVWGDLPALNKPVRLSAAESRALVAALDAAGIGPHDPLRLKLMDKATAPDFDQKKIAQMISSSVTSEIGELLKQISEAADKNVVLTITYATPGQDAPSKRTIEVHQLFNDHDSWYVEAWCHSAQGLRTFKVERIQHAELTQQPCSAHELPLMPHDMNALRDHEATSSSVKTALVRVHDTSVLEEGSWPGLEVVDDGEAALMAAGIPVADLQAAQDSFNAPLYVKIPYITEGWLLRQVRGALGALEIVSPAELRESLSA